MAKKFYSTFQFTGEVMTPRSDDKLYVINEPFASGWVKHQLKVGIKASQSNGTFVDFQAMIPPKESYEMTKLGADGNNITFTYSDRNNAVVQEKLADFTKFVVDLETDMEKKSERFKLLFKVRALTNKETPTEDDKQKLVEYEKELAEKSDNVHKFVHEYDFLQFIKENLATLKAHKVRISGDYTKSTSKGKYYTQYSPKHVEIVSAEEDNNLVVKFDFFFDKDAIDESDFKRDKKILINGYVKSRDGVAKADRFYPQQFVIDANKLDLENEQHVAILNFLKGTFKVKGKNVFHIPVETNLLKGAEQVEFTIDMLSDYHKSQVLLNLKTLDDYKPKGGTAYGDTVEELKFVAILDKDYADGAEDTDMNAEKDFAELIAISSADVKAEDVIKPTKSKEEKAKDDDKSDMSNMMANLFK